MAIYNPSGADGIHIDVVLTQVSLAWPNQGAVGEQLFPVVPVKKQSDKYYIFGREAWLLETSDHRAPGSEANEIPGLRVSLDTYYAQEHALQVAVTDEERENADSPLSPDIDGTELVTSKILLSREVAMQTMVTTAANYAAANTTTLAGATQWNVAGTSHPITDVRVGTRAINAKLFMDPNVMVIPYQVMSVLQDHADIIARIQYSERAILTPEIIAAVFGIGRILIPGLAVGTGAIGTSGNAVTASYLWGKDVILAFVPDSPGLKKVAFAYEFVWGYAGNAMMTDRWREQRRKSDLIRVGRRYDLKFTAVEINPASADFNKSIAGYLIKAAIA